MNKWILLSIASMMGNNTTLQAQEKLEHKIDDDTKSCKEYYLSNIQIEATDDSQSKKLKDRM